MIRLYVFLFIAASCLAQMGGNLTAGGTSSYGGLGPSSSHPTAPVVISSYSGGVDNALPNGAPALNSPSLLVKAKLPFRGGASNCAVMAISSNSGFTVATPTDDKSETWTQLAQTTAANNMIQTLWGVNGTTAGTTAITVPFTGTPVAGGSVADLGVILWEVRNCNGFGATGTMNTAATGSAINLTLSGAPTNGDMVAEFTVDSNGPPLANATTPLVATLTAGSGYTFRNRVLSYGKAAQFNTATTSTTVPITYSGTDTILGTAVVIKQGTSGTGPPATKYIANYQVEAILSNTTTYTADFPCQGNLLVGLVTSPNVSVSSITGSMTATWASDILSTQTSLGAQAQIFSGKNASGCTSSSTITPTFSASVGGFVEIGFADVVNANASPLDTTTSTNNGNQTTNANLTTDTITPAATGELTFNVTTLDFHTATGTVADANSHTPIFLQAVDNKADNAASGNSSTPASTLDEDDMRAYYINTSDTLALTFIYTTTANGTNPPNGVSFWCSATAAYK